MDPTMINIPPSPTATIHVGSRRKGPKSLPKLPASAFSPPNSGTAERFPVPPSPSRVHPDKVIDAHVITPWGDTRLWKTTLGTVLGDRIQGVIVSLQGARLDVAKLLSDLESDTETPILAVIVPFSLQGQVPTSLPSYVTASKLHISLAAAYTKTTPESLAILRWALEQNRPLDLDVQANMHDTEVVWERFEDLLTKATADLPRATPIILSNLLPPPQSLALPLVKLMNHPTYRAFQSQTAALSLFPNIYVKLLPPAWDAPTPPTPATAGGSLPPFEGEGKELRDWKRRIKMYLGPMLEAFGYSRIIFGSAPSPSSDASSNAGDWYEIARECLAELGVEQDAINAVFWENAQKVYGRD